MTHYHVKSNTGGALRDDDVHCVDGAAMATLALSQDLGSLANDLWDACEQHGGCGFCSWCQAAKQAQALRSTMPIVTRIAADWFGASEVIVDNPASRNNPYMLWMETAPGQRAVCTDYLRR